MPEDYIFQLYVNRASQKAIEENINGFLKERLGENYSLEVVDIQESPERAKEESIFIVPTLIKISPSPRKRIIGDFSCKDKVFLSLGI